MRAELLTQSDFFLLRTPSFSLSDLKKLHNIEDNVELMKALLAFFQESFSNEALFIASPVLHSRLHKFLSSPTDFNTKDRDRLYLSLYKYFVRMHSRCTPFGLFAGFALGKIEHCTHSSIILDNRMKHLKKRRLDCEFLFDISKALGTMEFLKNNILFYPNTSIYQIDGHFRYAEWIMENDNKKYVLTNVPATEYLTDLINISKSGSSITSLIEILITKYEVELEDAISYIDELIDSQILMSALTPNVTGEDYLGRLYKFLGSIKNPELQEITDLIQVIIAELGSESFDYQILDKLSEKLNLNWKGKNIFQTDFLLQTKNCVIDDLEIQRIVNSIKELSPLVRKKVTQPLDDFKKQFISRYGNCEISLCEALDPELGIGFEMFGRSSDFSPLVDDISIDLNESQVIEPTLTWNAFHDFLLQRYIQAISKAETTIVLTQQELENLKKDELNFAESSYIFGGFFKDENQDLKFNLRVVDGPSASKLIGRFCAHNNELTESVKKILVREEECEPDAIYAETVYVPQNKIGNVLVRPHLRAYEIPFIGHSTLDETNQIHISDLYVSIINDKIILRSKRLNKRIIPRESSAYHPSENDLPIYIFLSFLYVEEYPNTLMFEWPEHLVNQDFLPRIAYKNIVISPARWNIDIDKIAHFFNRNDMTLEARINSLREHYRLPRICMIKDKDNQLLLDLRNHLSQLLLADEIIKKKRIIIEEDFNYHSEKTLVTDEYGDCYQHEIVIPLTHIEKNYIKEPIKINPLRDKNIHHVPGGNYLYMNIFLGAMYSNEFLIENILPLFALSEAHEGLFFIRFNLPAYHLRIRFINHAEPLKLIGIIHLLQSKIAKLKENHKISDYNIAIYEQEVENYTKSYIGTSEQIFCIDSLFVLKYLAHIKSLEYEPGEDYKLLVLWKGIDDVLNLFDFNLAEKMTFLESLSISYFNEFGSSKRLKTQLDGKYRLYKNMILNMDVWGLDVTTIILLEERKKSISDFVRKINSDSTLEVKGTLIERYLHLFVNRMISVNARKVELLVYTLLYKHYRSKYYNQ